MRKLTVLVFVLILLAVPVLAKPDHFGKDNTRFGFGGEKVFEKNETIEEDYTVQFVDTDNNVLADVRVYKLDSGIIDNETVFKLNLFEEVDNLSIKIVEDGDMLKWSYSMNLLGIVPESLSPHDNGNKYPYYCDNESANYYGCLHRVQNKLDNFGVMVLINSSHKVYKVDDYKYKIQDYYIDYSDLVNGGFIVYEESDDYSIKWSVYKNWSAENISIHDIIIIDPEIGIYVPIVKEGTGSGGSKFYKSATQKVEAMPAAAGIIDEDLVEADNSQRDIFIVVLAILTMIWWPRIKRTVGVK